MFQATIFRLKARPGGKSSCFRLLNNPISALCRYLRCGAKAWSVMNSDPGYIQLGEKKPVNMPPNGHLAVYVTEPSGDTRRVVVPIIYFNHPLFGNLLDESERIHSGWDHHTV